jgi:hypothetical protein
MTKNSSILNSMDNAKDGWVLFEWVWGISWYEDESAPCFSIY